MSRAARSGPSPGERITGPSRRRSKVWLRRPLLAQALSLAASAPVLAHGGHPVPPGVSAHHHLHFGEMVVAGLPVAALLALAGGAGLLWVLRRRRARRRHEAGGGRRRTAR